MGAPSSLTAPLAGGELGAVAIGAVLELRAEASLTWDLVARIEAELGP